MRPTKGSTPPLLTYLPQRSPSLSNPNQTCTLHPYKYPNVIFTQDFPNLDPTSHPNPNPDPNAMPILIPILLQLHENSVIAYIQRAQFHQSDCHTQ